MCRLGLYSLLTLLLTFFNITEVSPTTRLTIHTPIMPQRNFQMVNDESKDLDTVNARATLLADGFSSRKKKKAHFKPSRDKNAKEKLSSVEVIEENSREITASNLTENFDRKVFRDSGFASNKTKSEKSRKKTIIIDPSSNHDNKHMMLSHMGMSNHLEGEIIDLDEDNHLKLKDPIENKIQKSIMDQVSKNEDDKEFLNVMKHKSVDLESQSESESQSDEARSLQTNDYNQNTKNNNLTDFEEYNLLEYLKNLKGDKVDREFEKMTERKKLTLLSQNRTSNQEMAKQGLVFTRYFFKKHHISKIVETLFKDNYYCSVHIDKTEDFFARYKFVKVKNVNHKMSELQRRSFENARPSLASVSISSRIHKSKESNKKKYLLNFRLLLKFENSYNSFTKLISKINFLFGQRIKEREKFNEDANLPKQALQKVTGETFERIIKKYYREFREIRNEVEDFMPELSQGIEELSCDIKDMMAFYHVLRRFGVIYNGIEKMLREKNDPLVNYYRDRVVQVLHQWQLMMKQYMRIYSLFNFWLVYLGAIFEMPFDLVNHEDVRLVLVQRAVLEWLDASDLVIKYRAELEAVMNRFEKKFAQVVEIFDCLEEKIDLRIPYGINSLREENGIGFRKPWILLLVTLVLFWKL